MMRARHRLLSRPSCLLVVVLFLLAGSPLNAADAKRWQPIREPGNFVVALAEDPRGYVWIGTEDKGVWRYDPKAEPPKHIKQFTTADGLGDDNAYAIAVDKLGRVWVGHLNHGVSVYNGEKWKNYDVLNGPIGERIFALAVNPLDGDVWMATSAGLTRYSLKKNSWSHYTARNGLPSNLVSALAFGQSGSLYVGTQAHGIAVSGPRDDYESWRSVSGQPHPPASPTGRGLPSALINSLDVAVDGTVYAATNSGIAWSGDQGKTWSYLRGKDWLEKAKGRLDARKLVPPMTADPSIPLLAEDYVTVVSVDKGGVLWLGFRQAGLVALDAKSKKTLYQSKTTADGLPDDYLRVFLPRDDWQPLIATYGGGVAEAKGALNFSDKKLATGAPVGEAGSAPALPTRSIPLDDKDFEGLLTDLRKVRAETSKDPAVIALTDDWITEGDWIDRYGKFSGVLCAMAGGGNDFPCGYHGEMFTGQRWIGRNKAKGDVIRHWVHFRQTDNPRCLQNHWEGGRKQSEWDDHGEAHPMAKDGPHVHGSLTLHKGRYVVSMYVYNKDGHEGMNRFRDFLVEVKPTKIPLATYQKLGRPEVDAEAIFEAAPAGARERVVNFWGGVYKRFYVNASEANCLTVRMNRNHSFNTILSAIFVDAVGEMNIDDRTGLFPQRTRVYAAGEAAATEGEPVLRVLDELLAIRDLNPAWYTANHRRYSLPVVQKLLYCTGADQPLGEQVEKAGKYKPIREDVARLLNDLGLFDRRDRVFYGDQKFSSHAWFGRTNSPTWEWNRSEYDRFIRVHQGREDWK